jgi:hypothetical protein
LTLRAKANTMLEPHQIIDVEWSHSLTVKGTFLPRFKSFGNSCFTIYGSMDASYSLAKVKQQKR